MAKALAIKVLALLGVFAALWLGDGPGSWLIAGLIALLTFALIAWGVFDVNSSLWTPTLWRAPGVNAVALTFDDGPDLEFTPRVLEILAREIDRCNEAIETAIGKRPRFYRAPHGFKNPALGDVLAKLAMTCVGWQVRGFDAVRSDANSIARRVVRKARAGGILLLHDGSGLQGTRDRSATLNAWPMIIDGLRARGFAFKRLDEFTR
jgi:peptidoglycan/xylan/chitin deacetylase (PgdA/CDA1 family)